MSKSFSDSGENEDMFEKIGARVLIVRFNMFYRPKWPKCSLHAPDPKDIIIFSKLLYASGEKEVLSAKTGARILDLWFDMFFRPMWPKRSF